MEQNGDNDLEKVKAENQKLKGEFRALVVEKNLMEERMYRAMNNVLNAKKKHLKRLERQVASLKKAGGHGEREHCETCRCGKDSDSEEEEVCKAVRKKKKSTTAALIIASDEDDNTDDPGSDYGSETDIDDIPASKNASPQKTPGAVQAGSDGDSTPERMDVPEKEANTSSGKDKSTREEIPAAEKGIPETSEPGPSKGAGTDKPKSGSSNSQNSDSQNTDYDMDELVDEFCS